MHQGFTQVELGFPVSHCTGKTCKYSTEEAKYRVPYKIQAVSEEYVKLNPYQTLAQVQVKPTCYFGTCNISPQEFVVDVTMDTYPLLPDILRNYHPPVSVLPLQTNNSASFKHLRDRILANPNHPAYQHATQAYRLALHTVQNMIPHFPIVYQMFRGNQSKDPVQVIVKEHIPETFDVYLAHAATISPFQVLSTMFQAAFTQQFAKEWNGYTIDINPSDIGLVPVSTRFLYYQWEKRFFRVPTFGYMVKSLHSFEPKKQSWDLNKVKFTEGYNEKGAAARVDRLLKQETWTPDEFVPAFGIESSEVPRTKVYVL